MQDRGTLFAQTFFRYESEQQFDTAAIVYSGMDTALSILFKILAVVPNWRCLILALVLGLGGFFQFSLVMLLFMDRWYRHPQVWIRSNLGLLAVWGSRTEQ